MTQQERKNKKKERESKYYFFLKPKRGTVGSVRRPLVLILTHPPALGVARFPSGLCSCLGGTVQEGD